MPQVKSGRKSPPMISRFNINTQAATSMSNSKPGKIQKVKKEMLDILQSNNEIVEKQTGSKNMAAHITEKSEETNGSVVVIQRKKTGERHHEV